MMFFASAFRATWTMAFLLFLVNASFAENQEVCVKLRKDTVVLDQSSYKYKIYPLPPGAPSNFADANFDDSQFATGTAAFGSGGFCALQSTVKTAWPGDVASDIVLRKNFQLTAGARNFRIYIAIDNDVQVVLNGQDITNGIVTHENCPTLNEFFFTAPDAALRTGNNLLAIRGRNREALAFLDIRVEVDVFVDNLGPPKAKAGPDQSVISGTLVTLDGSQSIDTNACSLDYTWKQISGPTVVMNISDLRHPSFTAPSVVTPGTRLGFKLTVGNGKSDSDNVEIVVNPSALLPTPVADPGSKDFTTSQTVSLSIPGVPDATIRYTLDGSDPTAASPIYSAPLTFSATTVLKAKAFKASWPPSLTFQGNYRRLLVATRGVYVDEDGNGRIDMAVISLDGPATALPTSLSLQDPFSTQASDFSGPTLSFGTSATTVIVQFADKEFTAGTAFPVGPYGKIPGSDGYSQSPFPISDSAGPVLVKAVSKAPQNSTEKPFMDVTFTEPIDLAGLGVGWPFDLIRNGAPVTAEVKVVSVTEVAGVPNTYRWTFDPNSPALPVYIDSLALAAAPLIHDAGSVEGIPGKRRISVVGTKLTFVDTLEVHMSKPVTQHLLQESVLRALPANQNLIAPFSGPENSLTCLKCPPGSEELFSGAPEWVVRAKYPFHYQFWIFDNLGQFIATSTGEVTAEMLNRAVKDATSFRRIHFRWVPVGTDHRQVAGTGVYILKGRVVSNRSQQTVLGSQGEPIVVKPTESQMVLTFGFLRK